MYAQIANRLGVTDTTARHAVQQACERLVHAKQQTAALAPREDTP
jgi:hypothetical protein